METEKILFIIASEGFQEIEYHESKKVIEDAGYTVITASDKKGVATAGDKTTTVKVDLTLDEVKVKNYDGLVLIGGPGALEHLDNQEVYKILKEANERLRPIGAICAATRILAKAGVLTRKRATGWNGDGKLAEIYKTYDVKYTPVPVVVEENIVTATDPDAAKLFGQEFLTLLQNNKGWG